MTGKIFAVYEKCLKIHIKKVVLLMSLFLATLITISYNPVQVSLITVASDTTNVQLYWTEDGLYREEQSQIYTRNIGDTITFNIGNWKNIYAIRIDIPLAKELTLSEISIKQKGRNDIHIFPSINTESFLLFDMKLEEIEGLFTMKGEGADPQLSIRLPQTEWSFYKWLQDSVDGFLKALIGIYFLLSCFVYVFLHIKSSERISSTWVWSILSVVITMMLVMAITSPINAHPDEALHLASGEYFINNIIPPKVGEYINVYKASGWGISYLDTMTFAPYLFAGKFVAIFTDGNFIGFRIFQVLLFWILCYLFFSKVELRIYGLFLLFTPQLWYVFTYFNGDAFSFFISGLIIYQLLYTKSYLHEFIFGLTTKRRRVWLFIIITLLLSTSALSKINYYIIFLLIAIWCLWTLLHSTKKEICIKRMSMILVGTVILVSSLHIVDFVRHDGKKEEYIREVAETHAIYELKPSVRKSPRDQGIEYYEIFSSIPWWTSSIQSFSGVYGYMSILANSWYYRTVILLLIVLFLGVSTSSLKSRDWKKWCVFLSLFLVAFLSAMMSIYYSWNEGWQAQGRYLLPWVLIFMLMWKFTFGKHCPSFYALIMVCLICLSLYSFLVIGIYNLVI